MNQYILIAWGSVVAPRMETPITETSDDAALERAERYSKLICNPHYWSFTLNKKDGETIAVWRCEGSPPIYGMQRYV